jgi:hypothetical protein
MMKNLFAQAEEMKNPGMPRDFENTSLFGTPLKKG